jgi:hypothetical protein
MQSTTAQSAAGAERKVTMTSIAFYLHTSTSAVERVVFEAADVNGCFDRFRLSEHMGRSVAYTESLGAVEPLVVLA